MLGMLRAQERTVEDSMTGLGAVRWVEGDGNQEDTWVTVGVPYYLCPGLIWCLIGCQSGGKIVAVEFNEATYEYTESATIWRPTRRFAIIPMRMSEERQVSFEGSPVQYHHERPHTY